MTDKKDTIEMKKRAHRETIDYLEKKKIALTLQLQKNRREINYLANDQRTFKKGIFYLINLIRLQNGSKPHVWNKKKRKVIRKPRSKNKIFSGFTVVAHKKDDSYKIIETFNTLELADRFIIDTMHLEGIDVYPRGDLTIKTHEARIILID